MILIRLFAFICPIFAGVGSLYAKDSIENAKAAILLRSSRPEWDDRTVLAKVEAYQAHELPNFPCFAYPLKNADLLFNALGKEKVTIFAYGSLLDETSAGKTLSEETIRTYRPAIGFGYSRTFDRQVGSSQARMGMLNLFESDGLVNGVVFQVEKKELTSLIKRERGYDLVPLVAIPWEGEDIEPFIAYAFIASIHLREEKQYTNNQIQPAPAYARLCRAAAARWGRSFETLWIDTTYLSDRKTQYAKSAENILRS